VNRRLYRCRENRVIAGVASGVAEFFGLDATLVRVLWFLSIFFGGVSLLLSGSR
jgi:phage shock protein PspC (stress-responsive transcriptional regulator)